MRQVLLYVMITLMATINPFDLQAQKKKKKEKEKQEEKEPEKSKFEKLTEGTESIRGYFNFYRKDEHLYMEVPEEKLNQDFLMIFEIAQGIGAGSLFGGTMLNIFEASLVALEKHDGKIFLVKKPHRYVADPGTPQEASVQLSYGSSVLHSADIETDDKDSIILIDIRKWFVSDLSNISERVKYAVSSSPGKPGNASFDDSRSYLEYAKSYPLNSNIQAKLTFKNNEDSAPRESPDGRYLPVSIHYTLAALPEDPMKTREADDRVGFFMTVHKDFTDDNNTSFFKRYVNKWRLECDAETGPDGLCKVKKPIVYYIDRTVPEQYRKTMMEGVNAWAKAFEAAGFRDAIHAEILPDDADAEDIRFATLRWSTSDEPGYGAIGPSVVDPRTGEILDADILFEANFILGFKNSWRNFYSPATSINSIFEMDEVQMMQLEHHCALEDFNAEIASQGALMRNILAMNKKISVGESVPEEVLSEFIKWVVMHEVGHSLGLTHNFRSSIDTPNDKLQDKNWAEENGLYSSVMEYPAPNLSPDGKSQGYYYTPGVGSYDRWAISYGYTPDVEKVEAIAREVAKEGHAYGTGSDAAGPGALDPDVNIWDLGGDPLAWGKERAELIRGLTDKLPEVILKDNTPYYELTSNFNALIYQYGRALATGVKYIGGQYQYRDHKGDPGERGPFVMISRERQQEALDFLVEYGFSENAFELKPELYQQFGANRWNHWGITNTYNGRIDYPYYETILNMQVSLLNQLTSPMRLSRIREAELRYGGENILDIPQVLGNITNAIWEEVLSGSGRTIGTIRRDLQRAYLDRMSRIILNAPDKTPFDAISVARMELSRLQRGIKRKLNVSGIDAYSRAHLMESDARIGEILTAGLQIKK